MKRSIDELRPNLDENVLKLRSLDDKSTYSGLIVSPTSQKCQIGISLYTNLDEIEQESHISEIFEALEHTKDIKELSLNGRT